MNSSILYLLLLVAAGIAVAFQSPINASLGRVVGTYNATVVSFAIGLVIALVISLAMGELGQVARVTTARPWQLIGGATGVFFVTAVIVAVSRVGASQMIVATIAGQMLAAMLIDHFGWFGLDARPIDLKRAMALPLLGAAIWLLKR